MTLLAQAADLRDLLTLATLAALFAGASAATAASFFQHESRTDDAAPSRPLARYCLAAGVAGVGLLLAWP